MDKKEFQKAKGTCIISEEVVATIACQAASEVAGVAAMAQRPDIRRVLSGGTNSKFVKVTGAENTLTLDVYFTIKEGFRIPDVAEQVQKSVKTAVQAMAGKPVTRVNVHVAGLQLEEKQ